MQSARQEARRLGQEQYDSFFKSFKGIPKLTGAHIYTKTELKKFFHSKWILNQMHFPEFERNPNLQTDYLVYP